MSGAGPIPATASFPALRRALVRLRRAHADERDALEREYRLALGSTFRGVYPKRKIPPGDYARMSKVDASLALAVRGAFAPLAEAMSERQKGEEDALENAVRAAGEGYAPRPTQGEVWTFWRDFWASTHRSTGRGTTYARGSAERHAARARAWGIEARVVERRRGWGDTDFEVWVATDEDGAAALDFKPESLRAFLRACWALGTNPRVYDPYLPPGIEERLGLDYFGGQRRSGPCLALVPWAPPWVWPVFGPWHEIPPQVPAPGADE